MAKYSVNKDAQANGDHEVHKEGCSYFPKNTTYLGDFTNCQDAVKEAKKLYTQTNGCYYCSNPCHTT